MSFALINSLLLNLLCVWILFYNASSHSGFRIFWNNKIRTRPPTLHPLSLSLSHTHTHTHLHTHTHTNKQTKQNKKQHRYCSCKHCSKGEGEWVGLPALDIYQSHFDGKKLRECILKMRPVHQHETFGPGVPLLRSSWYISTLRSSTAGLAYLGLAQRYGSSSRNLHTLSHTLSLWLLNRSKET